MFRTAALRALPASFLCVSLLGLVGCDRIKDKIAEKAGEKAAEAVIKAQTGKDVKVDTKEGRVTVQDKDGVVSVGAATKVPDDFPKSAPIYPGAKVVGVMTAGGPNNGGQAVTFTTPDAAEKVTTFYKAEAAKAKNKEKKLEMATPEGGMIAWEADDGKQISVIVGSGGGGSDGTSIVITAGKSK